jgi:Ca2+-binding EF-hand superfamily protein
MKADQALMMFDRNWDGEISKEEAYTMLRYMVGKEMEGEYKLSKVEKCLMEDDD